MALSKCDEIFLGVLEEKEHIIPFLDAIFGFLYRCTDFYRIQQDPTDKMGFPPGIAKTCVLKMMKKWENQARLDDEYYYKKRMGTDGDVPPAIQEVEVKTSEVVETSEPQNQDESTSQEAEASDKRDVTEEEMKETKDSASKTQDEVPKENGCVQRIQNTGDSYNGAVRDKYRWSQTILDADVQVPVPENITKARNVRVNVTSTSLSVSVTGKEAGEWTTIVEDELCWRINKDESIWSLEPGKHVQVHLEKTQERWWDALLKSEPKIDLSSIDATRPMNDLGQDEQMKIQELMWTQERKRQGLPTSEQLAAENILKEAWNKEGSPFVGLKYDPSLINFGNNISDLPDDYCGPA